MDLTVVPRSYYVAVALRPLPTATVLQSFIRTHAPLDHGGFDCTIRSVPLRWLAIGFRAFDKLFYNRISI